MKNTIDHAHVMESIRFACAEKRDCYSLTLSNNSAFKVVSIFGEHPVFIPSLLGGWIDKGRAYYVLSA